MISKQHPNLSGPDHNKSASTKLRLGAFFAFAIWITWVGLPALIILLGGNDWAVAMRYDRNGILDGQWWRFVTGHWTHLGTSHMWLNVAGMVPVGLLFAHELKQSVWLCIAFMGVVFQSTGFLLFHPELQWYVGLSGLLHSFFIAGCVVWITQKDRLGWIAFAGIALKITYELTMGPMPWSEKSAGGAVIVQSHAYGALGGLFAILAYLAWQRYVASRQH